MKCTSSDGLWPHLVDTLLTELNSFKIILWDSFKLGYSLFSMNFRRSWFNMKACLSEILPRKSKKMESQHVILSCSINIHKYCFYRQTDSNFMVTSIRGQKGLIFGQKRVKKHKTLRLGRWHPLTLWSAWPWFLHPWEDIVTRNSIKKWISILCFWHLPHGERWADINNGLHHIWVSFIRSQLSTVTTLSWGMLL